MTATTPDSERGRLAMHVLVDILPSFYADEAWQAVIDAAKPRLVEVEAIGVRLQDASDDDVRVDLDAAPLILGSTRVIDWLVREVAAARGLDLVEVVVRLREWVDHNLGATASQ